MPVEDDVDLRKPLTDAQIDKLHKKADQLERDAEKAERAAQKIQNAQARGVQMGGQSTPEGGAVPLKGGKPEGYDPSTVKRGAEGGGIDQNVGEPFGGFGGAKGYYDDAGEWREKADSIERMKGYRRVGQSRAKSGIQGISPETQKAHQAAILQQQKAQALFNKQQLARVRAIEQGHKQIVNNISSGFGKVKEGFAFSKNPVAFTKGKIMGSIPKLGFAGVIAALVIEQVQQVYDQIITQIKDMYAPGGILDVRKDVLNSLKQVGSIESLVDMEQGRVFFTANTGEILRQGVPQATNTEGRVNGYKQYLQEYER